MSIIYITDDYTNTHSFMCLDTGNSYFGNSKRHLDMSLRLHRTKCDICKTATVLKTDMHNIKSHGGLKNKAYLFDKQIMEVLDTITVHSTEKTIAELRNLEG